MVTKHWRKLVALFLASAMIVAGTPGVPQMAKADTDTTQQSGDGSTDQNGDQEEVKQVGEDGEVVQSGSKGKVAKKDWITKKEYEENHEAYAEEILRHMIEV